MHIYFWVFVIFWAFGVMSAFADEGYKEALIRKTPTLWGLLAWTLWIMSWHY
jgi:hypothetical protein